MHSSKMNTLFAILKEKINELLIKSRQYVDVCLVHNYSGSEQDLNDILLNVERYQLDVDNMPLEEFSDEIYERLLAIEYDIYLFLYKEPKSIFNYKEISCASRIDKRRKIYQETVELLKVFSIGHFKADKYLTDKYIFVRRSERLKKKMF